FLFQAEDGIRDRNVTGVQTSALPICGPPKRKLSHMFEAKTLDHRNVGQTLIYRGGQSVAVIQAIHHYPDKGTVDVVTPEEVVTFQSSDWVNTTLSPELNMIRVVYKSWIERDVTLTESDLKDLMGKISRGNGV